MPLQRETNMRFIFWFVLALLLSSASGQSVDAEPQVDAHVWHERYCRAGNRSASLLITLNARIRNTTDAPIEIRLPTYPVARVSRNLGDLQSRKYEAVLGVPLMEVRRGSPSPSSSATAIRPGDKLEFRTMEITFPLSLNDNTDRTGDLGFGTHFVQLEFEVWDAAGKHLVKSRSQAIELRIRNMTRLAPC